MHDFWNASKIIDVELDNWLLMLTGEYLLFTSTFIILWLYIIMLKLKFLIKYAQLKASIDPLHIKVWFSKNLKRNCYSLSILCILPSDLHVAALLHLSLHQSLY